MAFAGKEEIYGNTIHEEELNISWKTTNNDNTLIFVVPFLGQGGLKSDKQLQEYGERIREICNKNFSKDWYKDIGKTS